jgi:hypothetical protein
VLAAQAKLRSGSAGSSWAGTAHKSPALFRQSLTTENRTMGRGLILWLVGIPLPIILVLFFLGYLS